MAHSPILRLLARCVVNALGVILAATLVPGIQYKDGWALLIVVVLLSVFNAFLRPMLVFFALPFVVLTLGFGILFINAFLFLLAARMVDGFYVAGFGTAFVGSLIVSVTSLLLSGMFSSRMAAKGHVRRRPRPENDDVIDI